MTSTAFPRTRARKAPRTNRFRKAAVTTVFAILATTGAFWAVSSTLDQMTWNDCQAGVKQACDAIQR